MNPARILWSARSTNAKTGDVPTAWIGDTIEAARATCAGCPLLDAGCYAWTGSPRMAFASIRRSARDTSLPHALRKRAKSARMVRVSAIGDIGGEGTATRDDIVARVKAVGLAIVGYTHRWRDAATRDVWRGLLMASCDTPGDADRARSEGWRAAVVLPSDAPARSVTPAGHTVVVCPAQTSDGRVTCNTCRLCDASKPGPIVGFREHGPMGQTPADYRRREATIARKIRPVVD